jgi:ligand-binding sensor domain-containing protein
MMKFFVTHTNRSEKNNLKWRLATLFFILDCFALFGQKVEQIPLKRCSVTTISIEQGLMNTSITSAITDNTGFTWFSTKTGLQRYNGYSLETVNPVAGGDFIQINYPVFFLKSRNHSFLIGYKNGILEFNSENNSFKKLVSINPFVNLHYSLVPFKENDEGIWFLQENRGIVIYNVKNDATSPLLAFEAADADSVLSSDDLLQNNKIIASNDNFIFIRLSPKRIIEINLKTHQITNLNYPTERICGLSCNREMIFIASKDGLSCVRISDGTTVHRFLYKRITDEPVSFSTIELTEDNNLLVSMANRLFEFDTACVCQKEFTNLNRDFIVNTGAVPFIYEDKYRRIWLLSLNEIKRIQDIDIPFEHLVYPKAKNNFVRSIYLDEDKNLLLAGCVNGGIG